MMVSTFSRAIARLAKRHPLHVLNRHGFNNPGRKGLLGMILLMMLNYPLIAQDAKNNAPVNAGPTKKAAEIPAKYSRVHYQAESRRDPFLNPLLLKKKSKQQDDEEVARGLPPPGIAGTYIAQAMIQGITSRNNGNVAVLRGADTRAYFIREGDRLFDGYVKEIQNDSITFVRETKLKSGKTLTQDVTKRLRTP